MGPPGRRRLLPVGRPLEELDGPEGVVREVGFAVAAGAGDGTQYVAEVPELDTFTLGFLCRFISPAPSRDDRFWVGNVILKVI